MRQDLDRLMQERGLAGMIVLALDRYSPAMYYVAGQRIHYGVYFRTPDGRAYLVHDPMERDQAEAVGCDHAAFEQHGMSRIQDEEIAPARVLGRLIGEVSATFGMRGPVAWFGETPIGFAHALLKRARDVNPALLVEDGHPDILALARMTKSDAEVEVIRQAARGAVAAIERLRGFLENLRRDGDTFRANGGGPVRIGDLRRLLNKVFLEHGLEGGESIVSQGRDAGVPHNRGNDLEPLRAGAPLLVDIFPGEAGGGYYSDLTRTFCLGRAPEPLKKLYADVHDAYRTGMQSLQVGLPCRASQEAVCDLFESRGDSPSNCEARRLTSSGSPRGARAKTTPAGMLSSRLCSRALTVVSSSVRRSTRFSRRSW